MFTKAYRLFLPALLASALAIPTISAADAPVKREMRGAWVATVWQLDWPQSYVSTPGDETQIQKQKDQMTTMLDSLAENNFNAINFQVRGFCDAMYKSSYEPWSAYITGTRGVDPGYDPLEYVVQECHKRGLECHAYINPYRYESTIGSWNGTEGALRTEHPDWLLDVSGAGSILNPGLEAAVKRIIDVIREIVQNYDIDGVVFDDYFYLNDSSDSSGDNDLYEAYTNAGGTLAKADWRRKNVNDMIAGVYNMIQEEKPWVRFGVAPAGVTCTTSTRANAFGVSPCPSGSDWQYNQIYSDPLAWVSSHTLDYISPQIYWTIGYSTADYSLIAPWWSTIAAHFNRHFYSSMSISSLSASSSSREPGMSMLEASLKEMADTKASGPNSTSFSEFANEVRLNRSSSEDGCPGSVFYSCKYLYRTAKLFAHYLKANVFNTPALVPAMTFKAAYNNPGAVTNLTRSGNELTWTGFDNMRYTVYAIPTSVPTANFDQDAEYLLGTSYSTSFTLPDSALGNYTYAVCVLDRYGNEYSATFIDTPTQSLDGPTLVYPADGEALEAPFTFSWEAVENATSYIVEIASDSEFKDILYTHSCTTTSCSTSDFYDMPNDIVLYWRVLACASGYSDGASASRSLTPSVMKILSPLNNDIDLSLTPTITWSIADRDVLIEIATDDSFNSSSMIYSVETNGGSYTIPQYILGSFTTYFLRISYDKDGEAMTTSTVEFRTLDMVPGVPTISYPLQGGQFYSDDYLQASQVEGLKTLRFELATSESALGGRSSFIETTSGLTWMSDTKAGDIKISSSNLTVDKLYYMRVRGNYISADGNMYTDWSPVVSAYYKGDNSGAVESIDADANSIRVIDKKLYINRAGSAQVTVKVITPAGADLGSVFTGTAEAGQTVIDLDNLSTGVYIIVVDQPEGQMNVKAVI